MNQTVNHKILEDYFSQNYTYLKKEEMVTSVAMLYGYFYGILFLPKLTLPKEWIPDILSPKHKGDPTEVLNNLLSLYNQLVSQIESAFSSSKAKLRLELPSFLNYQADNYQQNIKNPLLKDFFHGIYISFGMELLDQINEIASDESLDRSDKILIAIETNYSIVMTILNLYYTSYEDTIKGLRAVGSAEESPEEIVKACFKSIEGALGFVALYNQEMYRSRMKSEDRK
jgi:hypothetical protein